MPGFDYLERHPELVAGFIVVAFVLNVVTFFVGGRRAERRFTGQEHQPVRSRERGASGYSNRSMITRLGGANGVLEVSVTDAELWIRGNWPPFTYVGTRFDMVHRIRRSQIRAVQARSNEVDLPFINEAGAESHVVLILKDAQAFMAALGQAHSSH